MGAIWAVGLMIAALWLWQNAGSFSPDRAGASEYAMKCSALAAGAAAQLVAISVVAAQLYRRDVLSGAIRAAAAVVFTLSLVAAIAFAAAAR
jgi:hypothetical protein